MGKVILDGPRGSPPDPALLRVLGFDNLRRHCAYVASYAVDPLHAASIRYLSLVMFQVLPCDNLSPL